MTSGSMPGLTRSQLLAAATEVLVEGGYREVSPPMARSSLTRIMEDPYGVVALCLFDTWDQLSESWNLGQGELVEIMSAHISRSDPKAWEGYLVLLAVGPASPDQSVAINRLRYDTNRVRKIVATGSDLSSVRDVESALLPLLPLRPEGLSSEQSGILQRLPEILEGHGISRRVSDIAIAAFTDNESILDRLHETGASR